MTFFTTPGLQEPVFDACKKLGVNPKRYWKVPSGTIVTRSLLERMFKQYSEVRFSSAKQAVYIVEAAPSTDVNGHSVLLLGTEFMESINDEKEAKNRELKAHYNEGAQFVDETITITTSDEVYTIVEEQLTKAGIEFGDKPEDTAKKSEPEKQKEEKVETKVDTKAPAFGKEKTAPAKDAIEKIKSTLLNELESPDEGAL